MCISSVPYHVLAQWRQVVHLPEVNLGLLHGLHTGVNGSHQSLLRRALRTRNKDGQVGELIVWEAQEQ